jgi:rhodanese-related sulfurtransferase
MLESLFGLRQNRTTKASKVQNINALELQARLEADESILLVDVRTPGEFQHHGHIPGSRLLPLSMLQWRSHELPKDKTIVCVCRSGSRSHTACGMLTAQGFTDVINLSGGMIGWKRAQLPYQ